MNLCRSKGLTCKGDCEGASGVSLIAQWVVTRAWEECGLILTVGCGLHLSSSVWQEQPVAPGQFLSGLRDGFLPSDDEGITWLRGQDKGPEFSQCRQDPGCL